MKNQSRQIYEFGTYRLDLAQGRLTRQGQVVALRPRLFDLLVVLVENRGQMLDKDELLAAVWPDAAVEENNLTVSVSALRKALGDDQYIENVMRRGYRFVAEVKTVASETAVPVLPPEPGFDMAGGAMRLDSPWYLTRDTDAEFHQALAVRDSIVLLKGARQVGKTSLLARGMQQARAAGCAVVLTDFQHLSAAAFASVERLLLALAELIADQLELETLPQSKWISGIGATSNFERYLRREVLAKISTPLVWALDEVDRLFDCAYASEIFGLFRSWHNLRALDPAGPWRRLTLALAYATEAHLFITDLNQSPFNVGTRLTLEDFTLAQMTELNRRYDAPLGDADEVAQFYALVGGHPYLAQRGFYEMARHGLTGAALAAQADHEEGVFGDHLRRLLFALERDAALCEALRGVLRGEPGLTPANFYRLRSAGVLSGDEPSAARPRCELYARYLKKRLL